jgi:small subunit ribosomal protein S1
MRLPGRVMRTELVGAFVDIGLERQGLLHISRMSEDHVRNVDDMLSEGDEITVWVHAVDEQSGRIDLTMVEPHATEWSDLKQGQVYTGTVTRVEKFGAFVDFGAERPGLVHVSELSSNYVASPTDVVNVGDSIEVKVINVNRRKRQIDLSMKALETVSEDEAEEEEELPTAMALALKRAMEGAEHGKARRHAKSGGGERKTRELDEIFSRTLQRHQAHN